MDCFSSDRLKLLYIRAQVGRIDLKVDLAILEAMRVYRNVVNSSMGLAWVPIGGTTKRFSVATNLCQAIATCFGVQGVNKKTIYEICKSNVVDDVGKSLVTAVAKATSAVNLLLMIGFGGTGLFQVPMVANIALVVPIAARLMLMLSCDLILIFSRAFNEASAKYRAQPRPEDIQMAAKAYQSHSKAVHAEVKILVPKLTRGMHKCYKTSEIELGVREIIEEFKFAATEGTTSPAAAFRVRTNTSRLSQESTVTLVKDDIMEDEAIIKETLSGIEKRLETEEDEQPSRVAEARAMMRQLQLE